MRTEEGTLEEYRKGDFHHRLNLYLQHRDLRRRFMQIDSDERALAQAAVSGKKAPETRVASGSIRYAIMRRCCPGG
jgi:hypothetical protein